MFKYFTRRALLCLLSKLGYVILYVLCQHLRAQRSRIGWLLFALVAGLCAAGMSGLQYEGCHTMAVSALVLSVMGQGQRERGKEEKGL